MQPFKDLWHGRKTVKGSINARYTSVPPQLVLLRATKSGHFLLAALCVVALLSNLLAVGLGGLFNELPVPIIDLQLYQQTQLSQMSNETLTPLDKKMLKRSYIYEDPELVAMYNISQGTTMSPWTTNKYAFVPFSVADAEIGKGVTYTAQSRGLGVRPQCTTAGTYKTYGMGPKLNETLMKDIESIDGCPWKSDFSVWIAGNYTNYRTPSGPAALEIMDTLSYSYSKCGRPFFMGWGRSSELKDKERGEIDSTFVICQPAFTTAMFNVTVDRQGYVLNSTQTSASASALDYPGGTNHTDQLIVMLNELLTYFPPSWHNDTVSGEWMNYLVKLDSGNTRLQDPTSPLPDTAALIPSIESVYSRLFALLVGLNTDIFITAPTPITIRGTLRRTETRIFMDDTAFIISLVVLGINILVATLIYARSIVHFLPRMPTTVGSIIAYLAPSRAMREYTPPATPDEDGKLQREGTTLSFGRFVGDDGRAHVGIELDPFVVPVKLSALKKGDTEPRGGVLRRLIGRRKAGLGDDTWL